jgi:lipopolysaccharide transport system ATP-binding protein
LRNEVAIFQFDATSASFGKGGAHIVDVRLLDRSKHDLRWVVGGETVILSITASVHHRLHCPIIGFFVKDRLGQALFGDNTYLTYRESPVDCLEGSDIKAEFVFDMPLLPIGRYSVTVAIANGTQDTHDLHHWIHDALVFESESSSVATGLIGITMLRIGLSCV